MERFTDKIAVITGAGSGIGRELALSLAQDGAHLSLVDIDRQAVDATAEKCTTHTSNISVHQCDVTDQARVDEVAGEVLRHHGSSHVNLLFNNAGIGLTESFLTGDRELWEKTFDVCWGGVYNCSRAFVPLVVASDEGHIVNVSSVNGLWASLGPNRTHSSYCAAKFAVRGFTEALVTEMRLEAPHVGVSVVMPGHVGTDIVRNSQQAAGKDLSAAAVARADGFVAAAPTTPAQAAAIILEGVRRNRWRILVGEDAAVLDSAVRNDPDGAYEPEFVEHLHQLGVFQGLID